MGGGGSKATAINNVATRAAIQLVADNIINCSSNTYIPQTFDISGNYNTVSRVKMLQAVKFSDDCSQDAKNISELQQAVSTALKAAADSQSVSVLGALGSSSADVSNFIDNEVKQTITQRNISNIVKNTNAIQSFTISGNNNIVDDITMEQTADFAFKGAQSVLNQMKSIQAIENAASGGATATQTNFISDITDSIFSGLSSLANAWVILVIAVIGIGAYVVISAPELLDYTPLGAIAAMNRSGDD